MSFPQFSLYLGVEKGSCIEGRFTTFFPGQEIHVLWDFTWTEQRGRFTNSRKSCWNGWDYLKIFVHHQLSRCSSSTFSLNASLVSTTKRICTKLDSLHSLPLPEQMSWCPPTSHPHIEACKDVLQCRIHQIDPNMNEAWKPCQSCFTPQNSSTVDSSKSDSNMGASQNMGPQKHVYQFRTIITPFKGGWGSLIQSPSAVSSERLMAGDALDREPRLEAQKPSKKSGWP